MHRRILQGDTLDQIINIPHNSIDCIITSPPYWNLRDYGVDGQLGLEKNFDDYLYKLRQIMVHCYNVLKPTGSAWINLDDTYCSTKGPVKKKSLVGIPQRFMINCIDDGWICRNDIIWHKVNAMPNSTTDRLAKRHEHFFLFTKKPKYYFDLNSIREKASTDPPKIKHDNTIQFDLNGNRITNHKKSRAGHHTNNGSLNSRNFLSTRKAAQVNYPEGTPPQTMGLEHSGSSHNHISGKNPGDVWQIVTQPFPEAHFATFPETLPERILTAACPQQVCKKCGTPRHPIYEPTEAYKQFLGKSLHDHAADMTAGMSQPKSAPSITSEFRLSGYTKCKCNAGFRPGIVLDPFFGSGTVAVAAEKLNLEWTGIELNPEYVKVAKKRLARHMHRKIQ